MTKRPVLREEIVVRTVAHSIEKEATATLRHEEADVEDTRKTAPRRASTSTTATAQRGTRRSAARPTATVAPRHGRAARGQIAQRDRPRVRRAALAAQEPLAG